MHQTLDVRSPHRDVLDSDHSHLVMRNRNTWPKKAATAHPNTSLSRGTRGCSANAAPANPVAAIGANKATASAINTTLPASGMLLMSSDDRRININSSQIAAQMTRQTIDAVRNAFLAIILSRVRSRPQYTWLDVPAIARCNPEQSHGSQGMSAETSPTHGYHNLPSSLDFAIVLGY